MATDRSAVPAAADGRLQAGDWYASMKNIVKLHSAVLFRDVLCIIGTTTILLIFLSHAHAQSVYPDRQDLQEIRTLFKQNGLTAADVKFAPDRRIELIGGYVDRSAVQIAFSLAQQVVGVRRVAPTTPQNIEFPVSNSADTFKRFLKKPQAQPIPGSSPQKYAVIVGVKEFRDKGIQSLAYSTRDAEALRDYLISPKGGNFSAADITLLEDQAATKKGIETALDTVAAKVRPGDTVIVYFSTHGTPLNDRANMGIVAYDTEVKPRYRIFHTSVSDEKISGFLELVKNANVMIVLDTCYSGMAFSKVPGFLASGAKDLFVEEDRATVQGVPQSSLMNLGTGGKDLVLAQPGGIQPGVKILVSASNANQRSWESEKLQNGFFTYHFIEGLRTKRNVADAYGYAKPVVMQEVQREKQQEQTPQAVFIPQDANIRM